MKLLTFISVVTITLFSSCKKNEIPDLDFRAEMRGFIEKISAYARLHNEGFIVIPQNGHELISANGEPGGPLAVSYLAAISGQGREDLFYGYTGFGIPTPAGTIAEMEGYLDRYLAEGKRVLVTDYCALYPDVMSSYIQNQAKEYISFAADHLELDHIPSFPIPVYNENPSDINSLDLAKNFLILLDPESFPTKGHFIDSLTKTNYDIIIIDLFFNREVQLTHNDIIDLQNKFNGGKRLILCYMSIGEAENYRYYWEPGWEIGRPVWLVDPNPEWPGNFKVRYWDPEWQSIIFGNDDSYLDRILETGFDGVYLDVVDAYEYFEE